VKKNLKIFILGCNSGEKTNYIVNNFTSAKSGLFEMFLNLHIILPGEWKRTDPDFPLRKR
jgi:hypothetical protein